MNKNHTLTLTALGTILFVADVQAAGFHLREQSAAAQGNAFAGATAGAENASYAYFNVAGLTRQKGTQINMGGTYISPRAEANNVRFADGTRDHDVNNIVHAATAPNMTISHQVNEKAYLGVALNVPYGMITKYDRDYAGSDHGVTSKVISATVTPMAAYKITDKFSLGAGFQLQYFRARLTNTVARAVGDNMAAIQGDAFDIGYQLGAMYEFSDKTRVGIGYRSEIKHKIKGTIDGTSPNQSLVPEVVLNQDIHTRLTTPDMLSIGAYHQINDKWAVMAEYQRVFWSVFQDLNIYGDEYHFASLTKEKWRDTNFFALGASYQIDNQWKLRLGTAYDQSAVRVEHRTPRIPDSDRIWLSAGLNYQYNEHLTFDATYTYIKAHKAHVDTNLTGNTGSHVTAEYSNSIQLFGFSLNYKF
jgi:long-chain fatty acid transport protein